MSTSEGEEDEEEEEEEERKGERRGAHTVVDVTESREIGEVGVHSIGGTRGDGGGESHHALRGGSCEAEAQGELQQLGVVELPFTVPL